MWESLRAERLLLLRRYLPLLLEEVNGERDLGTRASASAEISIARLNHLARGIVIPRSTLVEQGAELLQCGPQLLFGLRKGLFLGVCGIMQIASVNMVQKEDLAMASAKRAESDLAGAPNASAFAGVERVIDALVGLGLLGGLDRTSLQLSQGDGDVFGGHEGLLSPCVARFHELGDLIGLEDLDELLEWSGLNELHAWLTSWLSFLSAACFNFRETYTIPLSLRRATCHMKNRGFPRF